MKTPFRSCRLLVPALCLAVASATAQSLPVSPLPADPARAAFALHRPEQQRGTAAVGLPFFDDFTTPLEGPPRPQNWEPGGGAYVSNRLAISPLSRGAATLDGLKRNGQSYSNSVREVFTSIDTLTSQPIDLSGLTAADAVYLSFAWQEGSVVGPTQRNTSTTPVRLELEFKTSASTWQAPADPQNPAAVWVKRGTGLPVRGFRQAIFPLTQAQYLHGGFQFRFRATGNSSLARDLWNIDYVVVDRNRSPSDTTFADIATSAGLRGSLRSGGLSSPLRRYTAMPVWQFNAAPAGSELNPNLGVNVSNLRPGMLPLPTVIVGTVRDLRSGAALGVWQQRSRPLPVTPRTDSLVGNAANVRIPNTPAAKRLRYTLVLNSQEQNARTLPNDTIFRDVDLANYYAFDDGTAEAIVSLPAASTGAPTYFAYRISPNRADMVQAVRLFPVFTATDAGSRGVTVNVWEEVNGRPAAQPMATKSAVIPNTTPAGQFVEITFDQPVPVSRPFYVGYGQPSQGRLLHYGIDLNNTFPSGTLWRNIGAAWDTTSFTPRGALMMRVVMNNNVVSSSATAREADAFSLYPNPARGTVTVAGPRFARATVLDALGRTVWVQPAAQAGQAALPLGGLAPGVYVVRLALPDGGTATRRLILE